MVDDSGSGTRANRSWNRSLSSIPLRGKNSTRRSIETKPRGGIGFAAAVEATIDAILEAPDQFATTFAGCRFARTKRYPYLIIFRKSAHGVAVFAIAHSRRRPREGAIAVEEFEEQGKAARRESRRSDAEGAGAADVRRAQGRRRTLMGGRSSDRPMGDVWRRSQDHRRGN